MVERESGGEIKEVRVAMKEKVQQGGEIKCWKGGRVMVRGWSWTGARERER